ncbi:hypothetical protein ABIA70_001451 [Arthrobacter sp. 754]
MSYTGVRLSAARPSSSIAGVRVDGSAAVTMT